MSLNRRSFLSMTAISASLVAAAACGSDGMNSETGDGGASADAGSTDTPVRDAEADLVIWTDDKKAQALKSSAEEWGNQQGLKVAVQTVANELQSSFVAANQAGNGPDILIAAHDWIGNLVQNSAIEPVTINDTAKKNLTEVAVNAVTYNGQTYGVPYAVETLGLYVNKGLTDVTEPATIEELVEAAKAAGTEAYLALPVDEDAGPYHLEPLYTSAGGYLFGKNFDGSPNPKDLGVGGEGSLKAAEKFGQLGSDGVLKTSITGDNSISLFTDGKAPYLVSGPWALGDVKTAGIDYKLSSIPGFAGMNDPMAFAGVNAFYVASQGKNKALAQTFVTDIVKDTTITAAMFEINQLPPAQTDLAEQLKGDNPDMVTFVDLATKAEPMPAIPEMSAVWSPLGKAETNIVNGEDPSSTMTSAGEEIKAAIGA